MRRRFAATCLGAIAALLVFASTALAGGQPFRLQLTGAAEAPGPGDPNGSGTAVITVNRGQAEVCWWISVSGIVLPATGAHIHVAPAGVPGPVVVPLSAPGTDGTSSGCATVDPALARDIAKDPAAYYVNVHTAEYPGGAVRAQLG